MIKDSGVPNYKGCRIQIPTAIRYDRLRLALADEITTKNALMLDLLEFGMPLGCKAGFGVQKPQKNHFSALSCKLDIDKYIFNGLNSCALLGPFDTPPIQDMCYSPLMSVPKDADSRRVITDFSFPPGNSINDGISRTEYLDFNVEFSLPSISSMVSRLNDLGQGCLLFKRDLKGAFRQFPVDPRDYNLMGLCWEGKTYLDSRLAMGLRSSAYCCQGVTEMVARVVNKDAFVLVYLDDFGGAEKVDKAQYAFELLGAKIEFFGLVEARDKAVAPSTKMEWLGIAFDTVEWTMALKSSKLKELLILLPKVLKFRRVKKVTLQKILGNLVWASAVVRSGLIFFNRLLMLLRKLKRPGHSIYFSKEAKRDVLWWWEALKQSSGKAPIPPSLWIPLVSFHTDASLEACGIVWGNRALAGLFPMECDKLDISKKEMLTICVAIKHWFKDLANQKVKIFVDNQACVALINRGITRCPFLAACLREITYFLSRYHIELRAQYIPSKENFLADLCSRAFTNDKFFNNFNRLLQDGTLCLDLLHYDKFEFEINW